MSSGGISKQAPLQLDIEVSKEAHIQFVYLGNGDLIKQLNTELQRDEVILRTVTTRLVDENVADMFKSGV